jgi:hypothetical protein
VLTTSDGSRYNAFFRSYNNIVFVAVSLFYSTQFHHNVLDFLALEASQQIDKVLLTLCELPIVAATHLNYELQLSEGNYATLSFSAIEQAKDEDMDLVALSILSPTMLVEAWEALILERKVLVVSSTDALITPCCEFLKRLVLPLTIVNTYVPLLPAQLIHTVEAPFPYLLGANTYDIVDNQVDTSDTVIIDLDRRVVFQEANRSQQSWSQQPPAKLLATMVQQVNAVILGGLSAR